MQLSASPSRRGAAEDTIVGPGTRHTSAARARQQITISQSDRWRFQSVVPVAVKPRRSKIEFVDLGIADLGPRRVLLGVQLGSYFQPSFGRGGGDQADNHLVREEGLSAPVHGDERE